MLTLFEKKFYSVSITWTREIIITFKKFLSEIDDCLFGEKIGSFGIQSRKIFDVENIFSDLGIT